MRADLHISAGVGAIVKRRCLPFFTAAAASLCFFAAFFLTGAISSRAGTLIDVDFTDVSVTTKTGFAATGVTSNDFWNTCEVNSVSLANLEFMDGTPSGAGLTFSGTPDAYGNGCPIPCMEFICTPTPAT